MSPTVLALLAAASAATSAVFTKRMVGTYPSHQLIGPLLGLNCLLVAPFLLWTHWHFSATILALHIASAVTLVISSWAVFRLFVHGSASAVAVGQAMAPIPAVIFTALLLSTPVTWTQAAAAVVVSLAVLLALAGSFGELHAASAVGLVAVTAGMNGLLVVLTKLLTDRGLGVAEIYCARTVLASLTCLALWPPRDLPLRSLPDLVTRSSFQTGYFALIILAVQRGSPASVQTLAATTPVMLLVATFLVRRRAVPLRIVFASCAVIFGVALTSR